MDVLFLMLQEVGLNSLNFSFKLSIVLIQLILPPLVLVTCGIGYNYFRGYIPHCAANSPALIIANHRGIPDNEIYCVVITCPSYKL